MNLSRAITTLCLLAITFSAKADILYIAVTGRVAVNGVPQTGVLVEALPAPGARLPTTWPLPPLPPPQASFTTPDPVTGLFTIFFVFIEGSPIQPSVQGPGGYYDYLYWHTTNPVDMLWYSAIDVNLRFSVPGAPAVTISDTELLGYYVASKSLGHEGIADIPYTINLGTLTLPTVTVAATGGNAKESGPTNGTFTVTRTGPTTSPLTVTVGLGGSATNGSDYQSLGTSVTIPAGAASANVVVRPIDDSVYEGSESVVLTLAAKPAYKLGASTVATVTIEDNDSAPVVSLVASQPFTIELNGLPSAQFQLSRTGSTASALTVKIAVTGTAGNGVDYVKVNDSITIPAGKSSVNIEIDPITDKLKEGTETIILTLVTPATGYTLGTKTKGTAYLFDDDLLLAYLLQLLKGL